MMPETHSGAEGAGIGGNGHEPRRSGPALSSPHRHRPFPRVADPSTPRLLHGCVVATEGGTTAELSRASRGRAGRGPGGWGPPSGLGTPLGPPAGEETLSMLTEPEHEKLDSIPGFRGNLRTALQAALSSPRPGQRELGSPVPGPSPSFRAESPAWGGKAGEAAVERARRLLSDFTAPAGAPLEFTKRGGKRDACKSGSFPPPGRDGSRPRGERSAESEFTVHVPPPP